MLEIIHPVGFIQARLFHGSQAEANICCALAGQTLPSQSILARADMVMLASFAAMHIQVQNII